MCATCATTEIERLQADLRRYGGHDSVCHVEMIRHSSDCTCGWAAVEERIRL